jgi:hypothetical protein
MHLCKVKNNKKYDKGSAKQVKKPINQGKRSLLQDIMSPVKGRRLPEQNKYHPSKVRASFLENLSVKKPSYHGKYILVECPLTPDIKKTYRRFSFKGAGSRDRFLKSSTKNGQI